MASSAKRRKQCFTKDYTDTWPFITKSSVGENFARCTICDCDLNIAGGGRADLQRHIEKPKHEKNAAAKKAQAKVQTVTSMFQKQASAQSRDLRVSKKRNLEI